jgi:hypothetical protein
MGQGAEDEGKGGERGVGEARRKGDGGPGREGRGRGASNLASIGRYAASSVKVRVGWGSS